MAPPNPPWQIEPLAKRHDKASFTCGVPSLDEWLRNYSGQHTKRDLSRVYVGVLPGEDRIFGYYAIHASEVRFEELPAFEAKGLPRAPVPVLLLGRLAVDAAAQGKGLGKLLLIDSLRRALAMAEQVGVRAVEVDAIDDDAKRFYGTFGFVELADDPLHLYMPMQTIRKLNLPPTSWRRR